MPTTQSKIDAIREWAASEEGWKAIQEALAKVDEQAKLRDEARRIPYWLRHEPCTI